MIVVADWVVPIAGAPIRGGAVRVRHGRIEETGTAERLIDRSRGDDVKRLDGCIVCPGLVNAHTHLALAAIERPMRRVDAAEWRSLLATHVGTLSASDFADSAAYGASRCLASGTTVVGDVAYGPESLSAAADSGLGGAFLWEVLGISAPEMTDLLGDREYPVHDSCSRGRARVGLAPHSVYACGPGLLQAAHAMSTAQGCPFAVHVAETTAEQLLLARGDGPLAPLAERLAFAFHPPRRSTVAYLDALGVLQGAIAVHCTQTDRRDAARLASKAAGAVLCPRSNTRLGNGAPPAAMLAAEGVRLALGTDSAPADDGLDLFAEAAELMRLAPELDADRVLRMLTLDGATVLGVDKLFGSLERGKQADLVAVAAPPTDDPVATLLAVGREATVRAVMSAGVWRVLDGEAAFDSEQLDKAAKHVARKARDLAQRD